MCRKTHSESKGAYLSVPELAGGLTRQTGMCLKLRCPWKDDCAENPQPDGLQFLARSPKAHVERAETPQQEVLLIACLQLSHSHHQYVAEHGVPYLDVKKG
jgi:hypothetical protein